MSKTLDHVDVWSVGICSDSDDFAYFRNFSQLSEILSLEGLFCFTPFWISRGFQRFLRFCWLLAAFVTFPLLLGSCVFIPVVCPGKLTRKDFSTKIKQTNHAKMTSEVSKIKTEKIDMKL